MLRFEDIVFGPIRSRRLGTSLGVNILPSKGKLCNFDCVYCECGWNKDGTGDRIMPGYDDVAMALDKKLQDLSGQGIRVDSITFSGNGEPTMNPDFPKIVDRTIELRDKYYPDAVVSVLSNATLIGKESVFEALRKVDNPILKLDAATDELVQKINIPAPGYSVERVVEGLKKFSGDFVLQTMFLRSDDFDTAASDALKVWMNVVREVRPREIMVYTIDRETPDKNLSKYTADEMKSMVQPLIDEGFNIQIRG